MPARGRRRAPSRSRPSCRSSRCSSTPKASSACPAAHDTAWECATRTQQSASQQRSGDRFYVELQRPYERGDARRNAALRELARDLGVATVVTGDVHAHHERRSVLQDALVAIRCHTSLDGCEQERRGNHEAVLLAPEEMVDRFPQDRDAVAAHRRARRAGSTFDLTEELGYRYPDFSDGFDDPRRPARATSASAPSQTATAAPAIASARERDCDEELALISELKLSGFFLLHWEVLELAREVALEVRGPGSPRHALPPGRGRGSSVGSIVCYLTGLSHVDPVEADLSLGRFLNRELVSVPDIDLDFPRDIREKLIVRVTERYGREHAALVAAFSTYHSRGAIRDLGKALGLPVRRARAARTRDRGEPAPRRRGGRRGSPASHALAALARARRARRTRSPACRATSPSTRAGWSSPAGRSSSSSRCSPRRWKDARSASGTRTRAPTPAS